MANWTGKLSDLLDPFSSDWIDAIDRRESWRDILSSAGGFNDLHLGKWPPLYQEPSMLSGVSAKFKACHPIDRAYAQKLKHGDVYNVRLLRTMPIAGDYAAEIQTIQVVVFEKQVRRSQTIGEEHLLIPATPEDQKLIQEWEDENSSTLVMND